MKRLIIYFIAVSKYHENIALYKKQINIILKDLNNEKFNKEFRDMINIILIRLLIKIKNISIFYIYISIMKALITETLVEIHNEKLNKKFNYNIIKNLNICNNYIKNKIRKLKKRTKKKKNNITRINYIIPFHSDENNSLKENIYIGISIKGFVMIFYFNFFLTKNNYSNNNSNDINNTIIIDDNFMYTNKYNNSYIVINNKDLNEKSPFKIIRLEKCFEKLRKKNIFLVSFPSSGRFSEGIAKIIGISDDYMEIEILKNINDYKGLVNAIEINLNNNYYLLSCTKGFKLWFYNLDTEEIEFKNIIPKKNDINDEGNNIESQNFRTYKELIFIENRKILIVQVNFPEQYIFFYNNNDDKNIFSIFFLTKIKINKEDPYFSESPFNSCIIKDKYLLIGTKVDKNEKKKNILKNDKIKSENQINDNESQPHKGINNIIKDKKITKAGFYIINLDILFTDISKIDKAIQIEYIDCCKEVNCISYIRDNIFVCELIKSNYTITTFKIIEKNEIINLNKISYHFGNHKNINSKKLINGSFIICSNYRNNSILRINKNGEMYYFCSLLLDNKF